MFKNKYQNSVCRRGILHKFILIKNTPIGVCERCERCGIKKHFRNDMPNHIFLSWHIRSALQKNDKMFAREYPNL